MRHLPQKVVLFLSSYLIVLTSTWAQQPCRDTVVHLRDSICEGETYNWHGRQLTYSGIFYDTLPRVDTLCDSVVILRLAVLQVPEVAIGQRKFCRGDVGYDLVGGIAQITYYHWTSVPEDTALEGQRYRSWVHVNPSLPTLYTLDVDYRSTPQCPASGSRLVYPIELVSAAMHVWPNELDYDHRDLCMEDFSTGTREAHWDGWAGRHWIINGVRQKNNNEQACFEVQPDWGDTVEVMMEAYSPTCLDTSIQRIPFHRVALHCPNVFTPNGEANNLFRPVLTGVTEYELWLYDRRGQLVYHTDRPSKGWDGTNGGTPCPQGAYVYVIRYRDEITPTGFQTLTGTVTLLR